MELECDLSAIQNEDLLRRMWQQTADIDQKKEIRSHLYKLRESRLRDLYQGEIMAGNYAKDPLNSSHGDSLVGQNFQGLKSKEVRDSVSPIHDLKFHSMTLNHPNTTGWDVQTSSEVSPDGRAYRTETLATTDGVEKINGGTAEFRGRNEQRASASHQGDDKNFVNKASESSNTHLQERVVVGDENSGRTEMKTSSTTTSSSSQVTSSSSTIEYGGADPNDGKYLLDNTQRQHQDQHQQRLTQEQYNQQQQQIRRQQQLQQQEYEQNIQHQQQQHQQRVEQQQQEFSSNRQESSTSRNVETQQTKEQNRRVVDMDKASPEYQQHVQYLMAQAGEIISNTVEYPKPNVKMITTVKRLPDGTIVKNKRYETEELRPTADTQRQRTTSTTSQSSTQQRNEQQRREQTENNVNNRQQNLRNNVYSNNTPRRPEHDVVDNAEPFLRKPNPQDLVVSHPADHFVDESTNVETKFSSVKKSCRRFSTETTSETIEEFSDQPPSSQAPGIRGKPGHSPNKDFSTHGFPSVKPNKPTQEYPSDRPHTGSQPDFSTHGFPSVKANKPTQEYPSDRPRPSEVEHITQQTVTATNTPTTDAPHGFPAVRPNTNITTTKDGDVIIVSSESTRSSKYKTNAERTIETEVVVDGDSNVRPENYPNHGFPAVKHPSTGSRDSPRYGAPVKEYPSSPLKQSPDFSTSGFPSTRDVTRPTSGHPVPSRAIEQDGNVTVVSSETKKVIKHNTNREHIVETEIAGDHDHQTPSGLRQPDKITFPPTPQPGDFSTHGFPSVRDSAPTNDAYRRQGTPTRDYPSSPRKAQPSEDFSTHGFPSVRESAPVRGSTPSRDYPSSPSQHQPTEDFSTHGFPSVRTPNKSATDYSTPSGGFPSTRDTNAPKLTPTQPQRIQPNSTTTRKPTSTTDSSQRLISKERDVDATHRAFAASLRCSSPVDSPDHHRTTPRSSVSSTRTFRRDGREGSHDSETSRISSGTVTRSSPSKSVGKTVVTKQTVVKTRNVNGSNETIDLTPQQRPTKSPSPTKTITTTTTRTTTTRKSPEVPKPDNQKSKPAENTFPTINEPLTITKTHFTANDASFLGNEVVEEPCLKKHFYKLGPSDKATTNNVDEKSPYSPAPSNNIHRTHPKAKSQVRDDFEDVNHEEPIHKQPLSSSVIEPKQRNRSPSGQSPSSSPQIICQPNKKEPSAERRNVVRESEFENTDWQKTILDSNERPYPVKDESKPGENRPADDDYVKKTPVDTSDFPVIREETIKRPDKKSNKEISTIKGVRNEKLRSNEDNFVTSEYDVRKPHEKEPARPVGKKPTSGKPLDSTDRGPNEGKSLEPANRKPSGKHPTEYTGKPRSPLSPTRKTSDIISTNKFGTSVITTTTRKENTYVIDDDTEPQQSITKLQTERKPSDTEKLKPNSVDRSPTRKPTKSNTFSNITLKPVRKENDEPVDKRPTAESPKELAFKKPTSKKLEPSPTRKTSESKYLKTITKEISGIDDTYSVDENRRPHKPQKDTPTTSDSNEFKTSSITTTVTKTRKDSISPTRTSKPKDKIPVEDTCRPTQLSQQKPTYTNTIKHEPRDEYPAPIDNTPTKKVPTKESLKSTDIRVTTVTSTDEYQPGPKKTKPLIKEPSNPEYCNDDEHPIGVYDIDEKESEKSSYDERVPSKPIRTTPSEPKRVSQGKKTQNTQLEEEFSDTESTSSSFITTKIQKVRTAEPKTTQQTITDDTRKVQELFNKTDKTKITKNVNEEFITFERQMRERTPVNDTPKIKTEVPKKKMTKPKSEPIDKYSEPNYTDDDEQSFTDENTLKISSVTTTLKTVGPNKSHSPEYQPNDREPRLVQPSAVGLSDDEDFPQQTLEASTIISTNKTTRKENLPNSTDGGKPKIDAPCAKKPTQGKTKPALPDYSDNERIPSPTPTDQTFDTIISTTTTKFTKNLPGETTTAKSRGPFDILVQTTLDETRKVEDLFNTDKLEHTKINNEEFIAIERQNKETPDGAFISKAPEPEPSSPSFKKKGVSPRETFEDRCRQILGMENYGDTPGVYKKKPEDVSEQNESITVNFTELDVKIEDCEDDEPTYLNNIKDSVKPQKSDLSTTFDNPQKTKPRNTHDDEIVEEVECVRKETVVPFNKSSPNTEPLTEISRNTILISKTDLNEEVDEQTVSKNSSKIDTKICSPSSKKEKSQNEEPENSSTTDSELPERETDEESQPDTIVSKRDMQYTEEVENFSNVVEVSKTRVTKEKHFSPDNSPTRKPLEPQATRKTSPVRQRPSGSSTITVMKTIETKTKSREPNKPSKIKPADKSSEKPDNPSIVGRDKPTSPTKLRSERIHKVDKTPDKGHQKPTKESPTHTIKDRLRSATRNGKPSEPQSDSSPDVSPSRFTERRRSSNISVHTEIIIDHSGPKSPKPIEKSPEKHIQQTKKTSPADKTAPNARPLRRLPVTERKESAPVPSVTRKDKDAKMTRSTSEKIMKVTGKPVKQTDVNTLAPSPTPKGDRRPNKCFTTKTINLTTTDKLINSEEMENVIIDIQHAKSSREPSPDKIVPTPVPVHLDTGKPRYPDVVQEPEDEPRKKPVITNIPIFEEESNEYIKCHISEVKTDKISKLVDLDENDILDNPMIEAPKSLDYPSIDRIDDDCLLSVHEKVSKFTHTAEEIKKPKASSPFSREFDKTPKVQENDQCLLTVDEKVNKFIKTAEEVAKPITPIREVERPSYTDLDEELRTDDCTLSVSQKVNKFLSTAEKLAPTTPQRSPELVAKIERTISKQSEPEYPEGLSDDELTPFSQNHTIEIEKRRQKDILSRPTVFENTTKTDQYNDYTEAKRTTIEKTTTLKENEEVIPHTRDHTTKIELKRQKDILSRPSIYNQNVKGRPQSPNKKEPTGPSKHPSTNIKSKQMEYTTQKITREHSDKIETKGDRKPSTPVSKPDSRRTIKPQASTVAVTRSRFETSDIKRNTPKSSVEPKTNRVPSQIITGRKPTSEPKTSGRKPSSESITNSSYPNRGKPTTEPDSHFDGKKPSTEFEINVHDYESVESETEFTSTSRRRSSSKTKDYLETVQTEIERFSPIQKESPIRKSFPQEKQAPQTFSHSPTRKDTTSTTTVTHVTERTNKHNSDCSDIEIVETVIERPAQVKPSTPTPTIGRTRIAPDTVAARRNIFENNATPKVQRPGESNSPSPVGRRPSYMDHTVSSLEHIRRDSLEVNKHNYSRKSSVDSEINYERRPNAAVKFDVPHKPQRTASIPEDIDVENIFELEVLERLLETVTSYELRRRIRAQIRLVKKNTLNTNVVDKRKTETKATNSIRSTHKTSTYKSDVHHEETDTINEGITTKVPYDNKGSPKRPVQTPKEGRTTQNASQKSPGESPRPYNKLHREQNVTTKSTHFTKTPNGGTESPERQRKLPFERDHSPETKTSHEQVKEIRRISGSSMSSHKEYVHSEQTDYSEEKINSSRRHIEKSSERFEKDHSRERSYSPESKSPVRDGRHSQDIKSKTLSSTRTRSPNDRKPSSQRTTSPKGRTPKQRDDLYNISKVTTVKTTRSPERKSSKPNADENAPIWADRKNLLKSPSSTPRKASATPSTRNTATKVTTSKTISQRQTQNRNFEEDSITSSYGIGPTDENGLPLFGIKALKKKKLSQPCEATEEVTGYVIEEKYYSDSKTKPKVERKEYIYSTNADELEEIKKTIEQSRRSSEDNVDVIRKVEKLDRDYVFDKPEAIMPDTEDFTTTSSKYVRRGSVKELSEKFIRKESSQSVTEKSGGYPKAGLILRTSRGSSSEPSGDGYEITTEKYKTTSSNTGHGYRGDSDDEQNVQLRQKQTRRILTDYDDNEADQCHLSTRSSTKSTRSFLNSSGETKVVTSVDDALERMRNADYVVEEGDTAEDREARSLLNKFLGASVIMKGVESVLPTTKQTTTTTITKTSCGDKDDGERDLLKNKAVKTTLITKTTKSGSSSTPVTRTTCDIEEIWDEEILKELLEQATTYEERRKIRARLRDLMAEREEKKDLKSGDISENVPEVDESSASEYEEVIEEVTVTDYSDAEADLGEEEVFKSSQNIASEAKETIENVEKKDKAEDVDKENDTSVTKNIKKEKVEEVAKELKEVNIDAKESIAIKETNEEADVSSESKSSNSNEESVAESSVDKTDSKFVDDDKEQQATSTTEKTETKEKDGAVVTTTTKVTTRTVTGAGNTAAKPVSPFAKFRQLDKQNSQQSPKSPSTPTTPGGTASPSGSARIFQFTDPALNARAATVKEQLLQWCQSKTQEYENVQITNFSASWSDGLAFCALIHHFLPDAFDYSKLTPQNRRQNFELAFTVADEKAGIAPLLDVEDMVEMKRPDWKCVFIYVQSIYRRFRNCQ
nr:mucin-5AC isoform X5 [Bactrocera oleae]